MSECQIHELGTGGLCVNCGAAKPSQGLVVPIRIWVRSQDSQGRDTSYWLDVDANTQPVPKPSPKHVPKVGIPYAPRDLSDNRTVAYAPMPGIDTSDVDSFTYTAYAPQLAPKPGDTRLPAKPAGIRTHRAPVPVPAPADLTSSDADTDQRARRRQVNADREARSRDTSRDLMDAILTMLRNEA